MKQRWTAVAMVLALMLCLNVFGQALAADYTGTWHLQQVEAEGLRLSAADLGLDITLVLEEGGRGLMSFEDEEEAIDWRLEGDSITLIMEDDEGELAIQGDTLVLDDGGTLMIFGREEAAAGNANLTSPPRADAVLVDFIGEWHSAYFTIEGVTITAEEVGFDMVITVSEGAVSAAMDGDEQEPIDFAFEDGRLSLKLDDETATLALHEDGRIAADFGDGGIMWMERGMGDAPESGLWSLEKGALKAYLGTEASLVLPSQVQGQAVTAVGPNFLRENAQVIRVNFPEGIDRIEDSAFYYCESLLEVTLPRTLQKIGRYAFFGCRGLTHIDIPASAALIEKDAFAFCDALEAVTFYGKAPIIADPSAFSPIAEGAVFYVPQGETASYAPLLPEGVRIEEHGLPAEVYDYTPAVHAIAFDADAGEITAVDSRAVRIDIPEQIDGIAVRALGDKIFHADGATHIVRLPQGLERIGDGSFAYSQVYYADMPDSLRYIGADAFSASALRWIDLPDGLAEIGENAFASCMNITSMRVPEGVRTLRAGTFERCRGLTEAELPASLESIEDSAFSGCVALDYLILNGYVFPQANAEAFLDVPLADVDLPVDATRAQSVAAASALADIGQIDASVWRANPPGIPYVDDYTYEDGLLKASASELEALTVHWSYRQGEEGVYVTGIGERVFEGNTSLKAFYVPHSERFTDIGAYAFADSALETIHLFDTITDIGEGAFQNCASLVAITLPDSLERIGANAFSGSGITTLVIPAGVDAEPGAFEGIPVEGLRFAKDASDEEIAALGKAMDIPWYAPLLREGETSNFRAMPDSLVPNPAEDFTFDANGGTIEEYVGPGGEVVIPREIDGVMVKRIGVSAFVNRGVSENEDLWDVDRALTRIVIPETVEYIEDNAFGFDNRLLRVDCYGPLTRLGIGAFRDCTALIEVYFYNRVKLMDNYAFADCESLTHVDFSDALEEIGVGAFQNSGLAGMAVLHAKTIGSMAFYNCGNLESVVMAGIVREIGDNAFTNCGKLKELCFVGVEPDAQFGIGLFTGAAEDLVTAMPMDATDEEVTVLYDKLAAHNHLNSAEEILRKDCAVAAVTKDSGQKAESELQPGTQPEPKAEPELTNEPTDGLTGEPTNEPTDGLTGEPTDEPTGEPGFYLGDVSGLRFVCIKAEVDGVDIPLDMVGVYEVTFNPDGSTALTIGGIEMPPCPWIDDGVAVTVDYYGTLFVFERIAGGLFMNYYDTMELTFSLE